MKVILLKIFSFLVKYTDLGVFQTENNHINIQDEESIIFTLNFENKILTRIKTNLKIRNNHSL